MKSKRKLFKVYYPPVELTGFIPEEELKPGTQYTIRKYDGITWVTVGHSYIGRDNKVYVISVLAGYNLIQEKHFIKEINQEEL